MTTTPTAVPQGVALYRACLDSDDDTVRLAFADWLDEDAQANPVRVPVPPQPTGPGGGYQCPQCRNSSQNAVPADSPDHRRCASCKTVWQVTGTVIDQGRSARAELIRVQTRPVACDPRCSHECGHISPCTNGRADAILAAHREAWERLPCPGCKGRRVSGAVCKTCSDMGDLLEKGTWQLSPDSPEPRRTVRWHRGWPLVEVESRDVWRLRCGLCGGSGKWGEATPPSVGKTRCPRCQGTGNPGAQYQNATVPTPWAVATAKWAAGFWLTDKTPYHNGDGWCWFDAARERPNDTVPASANLPTAVFDILSGNRRGIARWKSYPTGADAAMHAVATATGRFARGG